MKQHQLSITDQIKIIILKDCEAIK